MSQDVSESSLAWVPVAFWVARVRPWELLLALYLGMMITHDVSLMQPGQRSWGHFSALVRNFLVPKFFPHFVLSSHLLFRQHTQPWIFLSAEYRSVIVNYLLDKVQGTDIHSTEK